MSEFLKLFGVYDLKTECCKWVRKEFGEEYVNEFCEKYDSLNRGIPIGGLHETILFVDMVDRIKKELKDKTFKNRIKGFIYGRK